MWPRDDQWLTWHEACELIGQYALDELRMQFPFRRSELLGFLRAAAVPHDQNEEAPCCGRGFRWEAKQSPW